MDYLTRALSDLRGANMLNIREKAFAFSDVASMEILDLKGSIRDLVSITQSQQRQINALEVRLLELERRLGILTHG
ncbi:hypothetical protein R6242_10810 [Iodobacter sp. CM08]|uniref:hypothetical protein n=1 Tax=Iodobacter sp. CM08 TaxID=3085902 RepID=UPI002980F1DF|nr:hypothetical protein [Iodobacter sp. CM08]MDW5417055.1 hypothetical protein [Iodobacter sp. CM08]